MKYTFCILLFISITHGLNAQEERLVETSTTSASRRSTPLDSLVITAKDLIINFDKTVMNSIFDSTLVSEHEHELSLNLMRLSQYINSNKIKLRYGRSWNTKQFSVDVGSKTVDFCYKIVSGYSSKKKYKITSINFISKKDLTPFSFPKELSEFSRISWQISDNRITDYNKIKETVIIGDSLFSIQAITELSFGDLISSLRKIEIINNIQPELWYRYDHKNLGLMSVERTYKFLNALLTEEIEEAKYLYEQLWDSDRRRAKNAVSTIDKLSPNFKITELYKLVSEN